jgi:methyl-accepting chemotaxis protein
VYRKVSSVLDVHPAADAATATPIATALPADVERRLARLVGIDPIALPETVLAPAVDVPERPGRPELTFSTRILRIAEQLAVAGLLVVTAFAVAAARDGSDKLHVQPVWLAAWGLAAAISAVVLSSLATDPATAGTDQALRRRAFGAAMLLALLVSVTGVVTEAGGLIGPSWVIFLPVVVVVGAILGATGGVAVGTAAGLGIYIAAVLSGSLDVGSVGQLVVVLPACPAMGWWSGHLASTSAQAAARARDRRTDMQRDITTLSGLLGQVADGDLTAVPFLENPADQATTGLAVVLADTVLSLRRLVLGLGGIADQLADSSSELATTVTHHIDAVEEQASSVSWTTSTITQLASTAGLIAETALRVEAYAGTTRGDVDAGTAAAASATEAMAVIGDRVRELETRGGRLAERVDRIAVTARLIDDMARRTTMLGVSAAIEAARAGSDGTGFATVAAEIGSLAGRAREATAAIAAVVSAIEKEIAAATQVNTEGLAAIEAGLERQVAVTAALERISVQVDDTVDAARAITAATEEQRSASHGVVDAMHRVTAASDRARAATLGHAEAAGRLSGLATTLRETVARFRVR